MHKKPISVAVVVIVIIAALIFYAIYSLHHENSSWVPVMFGGSALGSETSSSAPVSEVAFPGTSHPPSSCTAPTQYFDLRRALINAPSICNLAISTSSLAEIPSSTFQLKNLEALAVLTNNLESVPPEIGTLTGLNHLYIQSLRDFSTDGAATYSSLHGP